MRDLGRVTLKGGALVEVVAGALGFSEELMSGFVLGVVSSGTEGLGTGAERKSMPCWDSTASASGMP